MTKFNPENKEILTTGETLGPAMNITDQDDAKQYFEAYVNFSILTHKNETNAYENAVKVCKANLGYYAGYYDSKTRERVEKLFSCCHPIFGSIKDNGEPTAAQAFELGKKLALKYQRKEKIIKINSKK
jgi:hypothetical protein